MPSKPARSAATACRSSVVGRELLVRDAEEISRHPLGLPRGWPHYRFQSGSNARRTSTFGLPPA